MSSITDGMIDYFKQVAIELLKGKGQGNGQVESASLADIPEEGLNKEKTRLTYEGDKIKEEVNRLLAQQKELVEKTVKNPSQSGDEAAFEQFKELDDELADNRDIIRILAKRKRFISGLMRLKKKARILNTGIQLKDVYADMDTLAREGDLGEAELDQLLSKLGTTSRSATSTVEDSGRNEWLTMLQNARSTGEAISETALEKFSSLSKKTEPEEK